MLDSKTHFYWDAFWHPENALILSTQLDAFCQFMYLYNNHLIYAQNISIILESPHIGPFPTHLLPTRT